MKYIKTCKCGAKYTAEAWRARPLIGFMVDTRVTALELRNCPCRSTKALVVPICMGATAPRAGLPFFPDEETRFDGKRWNIELPVDTFPAEGRCAA